MLQYNQLKLGEFNTELNHIQQKSLRMKQTCMCSPCHLVLVVVKSIACWLIPLTTDHTDFMGQALTQSRRDDNKALALEAMVFRQYPVKLITHHRDVMGQAWTQSRQDENIVLLWSFISLRQQDPVKLKKSPPGSYQTSMDTKLTR